MIWNIFFMFGGVAAMMIGMRTMGNALEQFAGSGMKKLLGKATTNRFAGVGVGVVVTSIIQSSTATTVMLVGFVNIGLMSLIQAANVIMGANIGTTVTAHLVSLSGIGNIDVGAIAGMLGCIGILMAMLLKNEKAKNIGNILAGLGLIFVGLEFISNYAKLVMFQTDSSGILIRENGNFIPHSWVMSIFQVDHFPLLLILIGVIITALVHSSSTITSLMVVLASLNVLTFQNALFLTMGSNIGTCVTAVLAGAGASSNAKRTGIVHLLFNMLGCFVFLAPIWIFKEQIANFFESIAPGLVGVQLAVFHTIFNVITTLILLPFIKYVVKLACIIIPEKNDEDKYKFTFIDNLMLNTPPIAVGNIRREIVKMSEIAKENLNYSMQMLMNGDADYKTVLKENENILNFLNRGITAFMTKLVGKDLSVEDDKKIGSYYHVVSDLERVGDYAENIMEYAEKLREEELNLSVDAINELQAMLILVNKNIDLAVKSFDERNINLLGDVAELEEKIDEMSRELELKHIERVKLGQCAAQLGSVYLQTISNLERVGDHITNFAFSIKQYNKPVK